MKTIQIQGMELQEATQVINGLDPPGAQQKWADLGCGSGLFTFALAHRLPPESVIFAVDKSPVVLDNLPNPNRVFIQKTQSDFINDPLDFRDLDGILMANSLHFVNDKIPFLSKLQRCLKPQGHLLLIEYNTDVPNRWVPYPTSYSSLKKLLESTGFTSVTKLGERPSLYRKGGIYALTATLFKIK
ncbi:MAG: class I SAM-dependent methyltransferase [Spirosomataceae bacterium]